MGNCDDRHIDSLIEKANAFQLNRDELAQLNYLFKNIFCIYHLNEGFNKHIKEIHDYLESEEFGELVDASGIESDEPNLFNELVMSRLIAQAIISNESTLTTTMGLLTQLSINVLRAIESLKNTSSGTSLRVLVPQNAEEFLDSAFEEVYQQACS
jgi:hypothetical protein